MRKTIMIAIAGAALAVAPALAKPTHPPHPVKPAHPAKPDKPVKPTHPSQSKRCKTHKLGYNAKGTLVSQALTQTQGADTPTDTRDDRYSGDVVVDVTKANHKAPKGVQTFTLTDAKVHSYDANNDGTADTPAPGDRVSIHGKITSLSKKCDQTGFTQAITVRSISFKQPVTPPAPETTPES